MVVEALQLRGWALRVLAGAAPGRPPTDSPGVWDLFLAAEGCAVPLQRRLGAAAKSALAAGAAERLKERCTAELQRSLSLLGQLRRVGKALHEHGWVGVALKSGAELARGGEALESADLDVLVRPEQVAPLTAALGRTDAYRTVGRDPLPGSSQWTAAVRAAAHSVLVEFHVSVPFLGDGTDFWKEAIPTPVRGILRPAPELHLWHVLVHGTTHHPERRGRLRDLVLLAAARSACTAHEAASVRRRAAASPERGLLAAALDAAESMAAGDPPAIDPFARTAALRYLLVSGKAGLRSADGLNLHLLRIGSALAEADGGYGALWAGSEWAAVVPRSFRGGTGWERRWPGTARAALTVARSTRLAALTPLAWALARRAAGEVRAAAEMRPPAPR